MAHDILNLSTLECYGTVRDLDRVLAGGSHHTRNPDTAVHTHGQGTASGEEQPHITTVQPSILAQFAACTWYPASGSM